ncbi:putative membrane protein [Wickerhamomyces ciferrii]|uniref:Membrane protein n=1 Tax=Wickerhamomyces ciferrii (strain ATCC 14091 / BCRC 22168 / CBS 111 / JCM 3599 / NBRC 0793 / NRRL Y-1031 F-60-10) TaxID=1206466 RepID=K0KMU9_WICCF|nr:uncharacterized protein BN7_6199 [Wickerhamomyces ciferrii]CCH46605.1 putative membrane protein [Wickerhamomyces ciferrii]
MSYTNLLVRLIDLAKPFLPLLPEIELPLEQLTFDDKVMYTIGTSFLYLLAQLPIFGASKTTNDPIHWLRPVFGAEQNTLLEFGVFPIISSGLIFQILSGLKLIKINFNNRLDRELFQTLQKVFAIFQYAILTNIFLFTGYYGYNLTFWQYILINFQLIGTGSVFVFISEIIDKGYGFGSGSLTFITINISANFVTDIIALNSVKTTRGYESVGALVNLVKNLRNKPFKNAILESFTRSYLPNLTQVYLTIGIVLVLIYLQNFRLELPIRSNRVRSVSNVFPIKLLYTGSLPLLFSYVVLFYINILGYTIVNLVFKNDSNQIIVKILGQYITTGFNSNFIVEKPSILYFFSPSKNLFESLISPLRTIIFFATILITSTWFANIWSSISGSSPKDLAIQFKEQGISIAGRRDVSISKELQRVIPVAAVSGAAILATISEIGELFGTNGKSPAIIVAVGAAFGFLELIAADFQQGGGSQNFGSIFGQ